MLKTFKKAILIALPILLSLPVSADALTQAQIRDDINQEISETIYNQYEKTWPASEIEISIGKINPAIQLKGCKNIVATIPATHGSRFTVNVECLLTVNESDAKWTLNVNTRITQSHPVVVSKKMISKGALIAKEHVTIQMRDITRTKGRFFTAYKDVVGSYARRNTRNNTILDAHDIIIPKDIATDDIVNIVSRSKTFRVRTMGKALSSGNVGDQIKVINIKSQKTITCVIIDFQTVEPILN
jgi:flagella basal body P-ring formation protein FlgA